MNCHDADKYLAAYCDGELDLLRHVELEEHLAGCTRCARQEQQLRSLQSAVKSAAPYYAAPTALKDKLARQLGVAFRPAQAPGAEPPAPEPLCPTVSPPAVLPQRRFIGPAWSRWLAVAAALLAMVGVSVALLHNRDDDRLTQSYVAAHIRSLQVEHLTDVASSDRHTVKPWFRGKLDFSPPTPDLTTDGYPLIGGRLDYIADRPAAALVYKRRAHVINVFIRRASDTAHRAQTASENGYELCFWRTGDLDYCAIADIAGQDLTQFVESFRAAAR